MMYNFFNWLGSLFHFHEYNKTLWATKKVAVLCGGWKYTVIKQCKCGKEIIVVDYEENL